MGLILPEVPFARVPHAKRTEELLLYVGTYTTGKSEGIYLYRLNLSSGELKHVATTGGVVNPSFLALGPSRRYLYAVNEVEEFAGKKSGAVSAFAVDQKTGQHRLLNQQTLFGRRPLFCGGGCRRQVCLDSELHRWQRGGFPSRARRQSGACYGPEAGSGFEREPGASEGSARSLYRA